MASLNLENLGLNDFMINLYLICKVIWIYTMEAYMLLFEFHLHLIKLYKKITVSEK